MDMATGAMGSLLLKVGDLLTDEHKLQAKVKEDIQYLRTELTSVYPAFREVGDMPEYEIDMQVKIWAAHARDLSYRMEDIVDKFLEGPEATVKAKRLKKLMEKIVDLGAKIAGEIKSTSRASGVGANSTRATMVDPRLVDRKELVGIDDSLNELAEMLSDGDDDVSKQLKIFSILGCGGLGKTTLARAVYDKLQPQFECSAFVPVGHKPDLKKLLNDILFGINQQMYPGLDASQLMNELRGSLKNKRYFIIIDDIWDMSEWEIINCSFVDNDCGSRVITTTRSTEVARKAGGVYMLKPLCDDSSKKLFNTRLFGGKTTCLYDQLPEVYSKIIRRCGGVPLAIITIASLLVGKPVEFWPKVYDSIGFGHEDNEFFQNTRKILSFSYYDLPCHLKTCLLYLSIYPEDHLIDKETLIWRWVAEGFVYKEAEIGLYETGERYFNELINKSMIQLVQRPLDGIIIGCRVSDMLLDLIYILAINLNFVNRFDDYRQHSVDRNARRLAVGRILDPLASTCMHQVRSFKAMCLDESLLPLSCFQVLRVLALEGDILSKHNTNCLENIGNLIHLRYLGLGKIVDVLELPKEIGDLKFLQALDLGCDTLEELPQSVCQLSQLKCLRFDGTRARVPDWIGKLTSLEELLLGSVHRPSNFVNEVGKLTELRKLRISGCLWLNSVKAWTECLVKLVTVQKIQVLDIRRVYFDSC